jgi:hypothetical protein
MIPFIHTGNSITAIIDGVPHLISNSHPNFNKVVDLLTKGTDDSTLVVGLINPVKQLHTLVTTTTGLSVDATTNSVSFTVDGFAFPIPDDLRKEILRVASANGNLDPFVNFLRLLKDNPDKDVHTQLYNFIRSCGIALADDGHFLAYKRIRNDFKDIYSGTMDNSPGTIVEMPRFAVEKNPDRTCSAGLHFAAWDYLDKYASASNNRTVLVKINPADVVSIPSDYNNMKGRASRYEVLREVEYDDELRNTPVVKSPSNLMTFTTASGLGAVLFSNSSSCIEIIGNGTYPTIRVGFCRTSGEHVTMMLVDDVWVPTKKRYNPMSPKHNAFEAYCQISTGDASQLTGTILPFSIC